MVISSVLSCAKNLEGIVSFVAPCFLSPSKPMRLRRLTESLAECKMPESMRHASQVCCSMRHEKIYHYRFTQHQ